MLKEAVLVVACLLTAIPNGQTFRVATYNLNFANQRGDQVIDAISVAKPDLICFQETTLESERFLRQQLAVTHPYFHSVGHEGRFAAERFSFASKNELAELHYFPPKAGLFGFYSTKLRFGSDTLHVVNVHLAPLQVARTAGFLQSLSALSTTEQ